MELKQKYLMNREAHFKPKEASKVEYLNKNRVGKLAGKTSSNHSSSST